MRMKFAREGLPYICALGVATLVVDLLGSWWVGLFLLVLTLAVASFFRDPEREVPEGDNHVVSPADVHVNRVPVAGQVLSVKHTPGRFLAAYDERSSLENERNEVVLRDERGRSLVFVQVAGLLARRIVCYLSPGQRVEQGARFGMIMFGSRVDVYVSPSAKVRVRVGDRVRAGSAILAEYPS